MIPKPRMTKELADMLLDAELAAAQDEFQLNDALEAWLYRMALAEAQEVERLEEN